MGHQWAPAQGAEACTPDGLQPAARAGQPWPTEEGLSFRPDCGLSRGGQHGAPTPGCTFILKWLEPQDMWGRPGGGGASCVTREAGDSSHLMPYNPVCMECMHTASVSQADRPLHCSCYSVWTGHLRNGMPPASVATQKSLLRGVLMLRSPKGDRHQYQRGKLTKG